MIERFANEQTQGADIQPGGFSFGSTDSRVFRADHQPLKRQGKDNLYHAPSANGLRVDELLNMGQHAMHMSLVKEEM